MIKIIFNKLDELYIEYMIKYELYNNIDYYNEYNIDELIDIIIDELYENEYEFINLKIDEIDEIKINEIFVDSLKNLNKIIIEFLYDKYDINDLLFVYKTIGIINNENNVEYIDELINIVNKYNFHSININKDHINSIIEFINDYIDNKYIIIDESNYDKYYKYEYDDENDEFKKYYYIIDDEFEYLKVYEIIKIDEIINDYKNIIENDYEFEFIKNSI